MAKLKRFEREVGGEIYMFYCPGCGYMHHFNVEKPNDAGALWTFDGNMEAPTFSPSLMVGPGTSSQCHLFLRNGKIQFLSDCWHDLKGQTVDMIDLEAVLDA